MTNEQPCSRRKMMLVAGTVGLAAVAVAPPPAEASPFPRLDKALEEMREAKKFLQNAPPKFGGHKKKAIDALTAAIDEIEEAIKFASK